MAKHVATGLACFAVFLLSGCVTRGPLIPGNLPPDGAPGIELEQTPFFPQTQYQCGPAALATVLGASGVDVAPDALVPLVYLPARKGSLQVEMQAAPRRFERLSYPVAPNLDALLAEVAAGRPVLVLHNYGVPFWPRWHYAVLVGYDAKTDRVILRSGVTKRQVLSAKNFMRAWDNGGRWAFVVLRPGELPAEASPARYLALASDFERVAPPAAARLVFDAAVKRWPDEVIAWIGRGTAAYRAGDLENAARDYAEAVRRDASHVGARNNLAMTLLELGCPRLAEEQLSPVREDALTGPLRDAVTDTRRQVTQALRSGAGANETSSCRAPRN